MLGLFCVDLCPLLLDTTRVQKKATWMSNVDGAVGYDDVQGIYDWLSWSVLARHTDQVTFDSLKSNRHFQA